MDTPHNKTLSLHKHIRCILRWCEKSDISVEDFFRRYTLECDFEISEPTRAQGGGVRVSGTHTIRVRPLLPNEIPPADFDTETVPIVKLISLLQQHPELEEFLL